MSNRVTAPKWIFHFPETTRVTLTRSVSENAQQIPVELQRAKRSASEYRPSPAAQKLVLWPHKMQGGRNFLFSLPFSGPERAFTHAEDNLLPT